MLEFYFGCWILEKILPSFYLSPFFLSNSIFYLNWIFFLKNNIIFL